MIINGPHNNAVEYYYYYYYYGRLKGRHVVNFLQEKGLGS